MLNLQHFIDKLRTAGDITGYILCSNVLSLATHHTHGVRVWLSNYPFPLAMLACEGLDLEALQQRDIQLLSSTLIKFHQVFVPAVSDLWSIAQSILYGTTTPTGSRLLQSLYKYPISARSKKRRTRKQIRTPLLVPTERSVFSTKTPMSKISKISMHQQGQDIVEQDLRDLPQPDIHEIDYADVIYEFPVFPVDTSLFPFQPP